MLAAMLESGVLAPPVIEALSEFFQLPFVPTEPQAAWSEPFVAEALLTEPTHALALTVFVVIETATMQRLALHLLEIDALEEAQSLVLEVGNILMGALKTSLAASGFAFTLGLPEVASLARAREALEGSEAASRLAITAQGMGLEVWLRLQATASKVSLPLA